MIDSLRNRLVRLSMDPKKVDRGLVFPLLTLLVIVSGCSPVKGYAGPERPDTETATLTPALNQDYDIPRSAKMDTIPFSDDGITVLPGKHAIEFIFTRKGGKLECEKYSTFDDAGFNACLSNEKHRDNCSCWDYVTIRERCLHEVRDVTCTDSLTLKADHRYDILGIGDFNRPSLDVVVRDSGSSIKKLTCRSSSVESQAFEESVGTGEFTAQQYGVRTACDRY